MRVQLRESNIEIESFPLEFFSTKATFELRGLIDIGREQFLIFSRENMLLWLKGQTVTVERRFGPKIMYRESELQFTWPISKTPELILHFQPFRSMRKIWMQFRDCMQHSTREAFGDHFFVNLSQNVDLNEK